MRETTPDRFCHATSLRSEAPNRKRESDNEVYLVNRCRNTKEYYGLQYE